jgi:hypothetical protein
MARANGQEISQADLVSYLRVPQVDLFHGVSWGDRHTNPPPANQYQCTIILHQDLQTSFG